jgi:N6-adenosine-specific RNA methylase IME4
MGLFGIRGQVCTLTSGRIQVNIVKTQKREHARKPGELYAIIEAGSPGPFLELCARGQGADWDQWGNEVVDYVPSWPTYANHTSMGRGSEHEDGYLDH